MIKEPIAFTWSPNPTMFKGIYDPTKQYYVCKPFLDKLRHCCTDDSVMYPELNTAGNIHFHGKLTIKDNVKWYKSVLPSFKRSGYVCIKTKLNEEWDKYICKDVEDMQKILKINITSLPLKVSDITLEYKNKLRRRKQSAMAEQELIKSQSMRALITALKTP